GLAAFEGDLVLEVEFELLQQVGELVGDAVELDLELGGVDFEEHLPLGDLLAEAQVGGEHATVDFAGDGDFVGRADFDDGGHGVHGLADLDGGGVNGGPRAVPDEEAGGEQREEGKDE